MKSIDISIIIPIYNGERYIVECLESILKQNYKSIEIIIIDDGSEDDSYNICKKYANDYSFIKIYHQENNGVSSARNYGLDNANGKYIYFMDSDDTININFFSIVMQNIKNYDLITFNWAAKYINYQRECGIQKKHILDSHTSMELACSSDNSFQGYLWNKVFLNKIIKENNLKFKENISICEDLVFVMQYLLYCTKVNSIDNILYNYRIRKNSVSKKFSLNKFKSMFEAYDIILDICDKNNISNSINIKYEYLYNYFLYKKFFNKNNFYISDNVLGFYKEVIHCKLLKFKKRKDLFFVKNFLYPYKIYHKIINKFKKKYILYE